MKPIPTPQRLAARQAALDMLGCGPVSTCMLAGKLISRNLLRDEESIGDAYRLARDVLDGLVLTKEAKFWEEEQCWTIASV